MSDKPGEDYFDPRHSYNKFRSFIKRMNPDPSPPNVSNFTFDNITTRSYDMLYDLAYTRVFGHELGYLAYRTMMPPPFRMGIEVGTGRMNWDEAIWNTAWSMIGFAAAGPWGGMIGGNLAGMTYDKKDWKPTFGDDVSTYVGEKFISLWQGGRDDIGTVFDKYINTPWERGPNEPTPYRMTKDDYHRAHKERLENAGWVNDPGTNKYRQTSRENRSGPWKARGTRGMWSSLHG